MTRTWRVYVDAIALFENLLFWRIMSNSCAAWLSTQTHSKWEHVEQAPGRMSLLLLTAHMCKGRLSKSLFHSFHTRSQKPEEETTDCRQRAVSREQGSQSPPLLMLTCAFFRNERRTRSNQQSSSATAKALVCRQASQLLLRTNKTDTISWHHHEVKKHDPFRSHSILSINNPSQAASSYMITKYLKVTCICPKIYFFDAHILWLVLCTTPCCLSGLTLQSPGSDSDSEV